MHVLIPAEPEIVKVTAPAGATALREPVTVAVKVTAPPKVKVEAEEVIAMVGAPSATVVEVEELVVETELYAVSPWNVKAPV
jgi:hypothetical protein